MTTMLKAAEAIADTLTDSGFDVRSPTCGSAVDLKVTNVRSALCELTIWSNGAVIWDYLTFDGPRTSAEHIVSIMLDLLSPDWDETAPLRLSALPDLMLKGLVGRALVERGMTVALSKPDSDDRSFEVDAEIIITNPADLARGTAHLTDDGAICWECRLHGTAEGQAGLTVTDIAETITRALRRTQAASCAA